MSLRIILASFVFVAAAAYTISAETESSSVTTVSDELKRMFEEDQADRKPPSGKGVDWAFVGPRDEAREIRVKEMVASGALQTGADFYHAAMILHHAQTPDDYLLAHDLCIVAISKGEERAKWLSAASMDRFLVSVGRPQRFGTQFGGSRPGAPIKLRPVDPSVPDNLRRAFNVPPLAEARAREA